MQNSKRVAINTIAQYTRTGINMLLSLYTVRIVLITLGASDFGIYSVVAGVTTMLAFITNALVTTTQRFMSFYQGQNNMAKMKEVFSNSEIMHLAVGCVLVIALFALTPLLFNGFLNIDIQRIDAAKHLYYIVVVMLFVTFCVAPFRALLISHENIVYISIIDVVDGVLRVIVVTLLSYVSYDKLVIYGVFLLGIQVFNFLAFAWYSFNKYEECIVPKMSLFSKAYFKELSSFAGWVVYGTGCYIVKNQGIDIVINKALSTVANAAYGVGRQVSGAVSTVSGSLLNAMRPQIVKAEGAGDREKSISLATILCKFAFFLLSALCIPCVFEMPRLLQLWLKEVPEYTVLFARMAMIAAMADTLTGGLSVANEAIGNVKQYNLVIGTLKFMALPFSAIFMYYGCNLIYVVISYIGMEFISAIARIPFLHKTGGLIISKFIKEVIFREAIPVFVSFSVCYCCVRFIESEWRFLVTFPLSILLYAIVIWLLGLTKQERTMIYSMAFQNNK
ncbi:MAG: lipopolysaccharide biosynthesis protein [Acetivibrionales bacterium]|jgi:O-antigen/teichoic acid export membrane protein